jgi:hypothetical protein
MATFAADIGSDPHILSLSIQGKRKWTESLAKRVEVGSKGKIRASDLVGEVSSVAV